MATAKTALVTGGAKRVGLAVVERLLEAGYDVAFTYRGSAEAAADQVRRSAGSGQRRVPFHVDFETPTAVGDFVESFRQQFDTLDVLVNCASLFIPDDAPQGATPALQRRLLEVNAIAPASLTSALSPELTAAGGCVVNFLDLLAERPWPAYSAYCASKAALHATTLAHARKFAPAVRVNGIAPGVIDWPDDMPEADRAAYLKRVPLARAGTPREAADVVHWLATAAPYVTGQVIRLDGGRSLT